MKVISVVGTRPQFVKASVVTKCLRNFCQEVLVHTGQHYDQEMSEVFFDELRIPKPDYNLGISGGTHAQMTSSMLVSIEEVLLKEKPTIVLVYGDTNSTLAAALAAVKLRIPICHVEAGNRIGAITNPEEVNRICTDHVSTLLFCCTESAMESLAREGLVDRAQLTGDPMYDAYQYFGDASICGINPRITTLIGNQIGFPREYYYLTYHRQENAENREKLTEVLMAMNSLDAPTVYPVHPRNREQVVKLYDELHISNVILVKPVSYLTSLKLVKGAKAIVTDSGGLQREAFFAQRQCITLFDYVIWPETMHGNRNQLAKPDKNDIVGKLQAAQSIDPFYLPFGDGHAAEKIVGIIANWREIK